MEENSKTIQIDIATEGKHKVKHIDFRVTEEQYNLIASHAASCGKTISDYVRDLVLGFIPHLLMTDEQAQALTALVAARSELIRFRNAFEATPKSKRKQLFKSVEFMKKWLKYINYLIECWGKIKNHFLDIYDDDSIRKSDSPREGDDAVRN